MSISVFLSHNHNDKPFVRKLARDLENHGVHYWLDEAEMKIGDSGNDSNLLIVFYVQIMPDDFVMQLHR
ncbi:toll/interleukin-1 receptor domain-containing protein, partial [Escherichia coli]